MKLNWSLKFEYFDSELFFCVFNSSVVNFFLTGVENNFSPLCYVSITYAWYASYESWAIELSLNSETKEKLCLIILSLIGFIWSLDSLSCSCINSFMSAVSRLSGFD